MKRLFFLLAAGIFAAACNQGTQTGNDGETDKSLLEDQQEPFGDQSARSPANDGIVEYTVNSQEEFVTTAASGGMMEVRLGEMAAKQASSSEVRDFGRMMVQDHSQANEKLRQAAAGIQVEIPQELKSEHQQKVSMLETLSAEEFDAQYMEMMVQAHQQDISMFEQFQDQIESQELRAWVEETLPTLRNHLEQAQQIRQNLQGTARM